MQILFPDIHLQLTKSMSMAFNELGHTLIIPSKEYIPEIRSSHTEFVWNREWTQEKADDVFGGMVKVSSKEELLDVPPDVIFVSAFENQFEMLDLWSKLEGKPNIAAYSGNDYWQGAYNLNVIKNYLAADLTGYTLARAKCRNYLHYFPWIDYNKLTFNNYSDSNIIGTYISEYQKNFPRDYSLYMGIKNELNYLDFKLCDKSPHSEIINTIDESVASLHIKSLEGYGFAVIESMAKGRPVFLMREQCYNKTLYHWSLENLTALFFDDLRELKIKLDLLINNLEYRHFLQKTCASTIRQAINNDEQTENLKDFLNNLV